MSVPGKICMINTPNQKYYRSELSNSSAQRLEGRLADLMVEMQMVRNAIQNTRPAAMLEDVMSEVPPSYDKDNHDVGEQAV